MHAVRGATRGCHGQFTVFRTFWLLRASSAVALRRWNAIVRVSNAWIVTHELLIVKEQGQIKGEEDISINCPFIGIVIENLQVRFVPV